MENLAKQLIIPPVPAEEPKSTDYVVRVNGQEVPCQLARVSAMPFNRGWPGKERPIDQTELASFVVFEMGQPVEVEVIANRAFDDVVIRPLSKKIALTVTENTIRFTIEKPGQFSLELNGRHKNLAIFANPIKEYVPGADVLYYGPGVHDIEKLELHSGQTMFVDRGAVVYARTIRAYDSENIRIIGHGVIDFSRYERTVGDVFVEEDSGSISFTRCKNVTVDGVILRDPTWWTTTSINCINVVFNNVKLIGLWRYNADGIDFVNSQNVRITNCYIRSFDDSISIKGVNKYRDGVMVERHDHMSVQNYLIENCVLWCDWGGALEIGAETVADEYSNIIYRNCDVIRIDQSPMRIHSGASAEIHHVLYENICAEYSKYDTNPVLQETDDQVYTPKETPWAGAIIRAFMYWGSWWVPGEPRFKSVHDITYRNIQIFKDEEVPMPAIGFNGSQAELGFSDILIDGIYCNGEKLTMDTVYIDELLNTKNFVIK